ncbi:MAG: Cthe_2314 family HEPN domain-containing protein [Pseudomonadota bacterium]
MNKPEKSKSLCRSSVVPIESYALNALRAADFHFKKINSIINECESKWNKASDKEKEQVLQNPMLQLEIGWYMRAFFWELYSVFDLINHWANERFALELSGKNIRWETVSERKKKCNDPINWSLAKEAIKQKRDQQLFIEIKNYRNFAHEGAPTIQIITDSTAGTWRVFIPVAIEGQTQYVDIREQLPKYIAFTEESGRDIFLHK